MTAATAAGPGGEAQASLVFWGHPFSSYCQKVLVALYENDTPFEYRRLDFGDPQAVAAFGAVWPLQRMPVLVDRGRAIVESSCEIEYLQLEHPGRTRFLPGDPRAAL